MGAYSRSKGIRFERDVARRIREYGLVCKRVLEYDGFSHGIDLQVYDPLDLKLISVGIQVKNTADLGDLYRGFLQAKAGWPDCRGWACIHRWSDPDRKPGQFAVERIMVQMHTELEHSVVDWAGFLAFLECCR